MQGEGGENLLQEMRINAVDEIRMRGGGGEILLQEVMIKKAEKTEQIEAIAGHRREEMTAGERKQIQVVTQELARE